MDAKTEQEAVERIAELARKVRRQPVSKATRSHMDAIIETAATLRRSLEEARKDRDAAREQVANMALRALLTPSPSAPEQESEGCGNEWAEKRDAWVARVRAEKNRLDDSWSGSKGVGAMGLGFGEVEALLELLERATFAPDCSAPASSVEGTDRYGAGGLEEHIRYTVSQVAEGEMRVDHAVRHVLKHIERYAALQRRSGVEGTEGLRTRGTPIRDLGTIEFNDGMDDDAPAPQTEGDEDE